MRIDIKRSFSYYLNLWKKNLIYILENYVLNNPFTKILTLVFIVISASVIFFNALFSISTLLQESIIIFKPAKKIISEEITDNYEYIKKVKQENKLLENRLSMLIPGGNYLIINTSLNRFKLCGNNKLKLEGDCSTGSFILLESDHNQKWIFQTPKGVFNIKGKVEYPVWRKPDWAFIEEGLPVPSAHDPSRFEYGVLGNYALDLGDGYLIHGTIYKRLIGKPVTHGCVRMYDDDLETVYNSLRVGSKVFIF